MEKSENTRSRRHSLTWRLASCVHVNIAIVCLFFGTFAGDLCEMTFKSLMNFGSPAKNAYYPTTIDRYHHSGSGGYHNSGSGGYYHSPRGSYKDKGGSNAALSALTLLAFLFLINVMQQSMQDNASMQTTTMATFVIRDSEQPIAVVAKEGKEGNGKREEEAERINKRHGTPSKSTIQRLNDQYIK